MIQVIQMQHSEIETITCSKYNCLECLIVVKDAANLCFAKMLVVGEIPIAEN